MILIFTLFLHFSSINVEAKETNLGINSSNATYIRDMKRIQIRKTHSWDRCVNDTESPEGLLKNTASFKCELF